MSTALAPAWTMRQARTPDAHQMSRMINTYAAQGLMVTRTAGELAARVGEFVVAFEPDGGRMAACGGLRRHDRGLAEVVSLAVREDLRAQGLGRELLLTLVGEAGAMGVGTVFARTVSPDFFLLQGFERTRRDAFPGQRAPRGGARVAVARRLPPVGFHSRG